MNPVGTERPQAWGSIRAAFKFTFGCLAYAVTALHIQVGSVDLMAIQQSSDGVSGLGPVTAAKQGISDIIVFGLHPTNAAWTDVNMARTVTVTTIPITRVTF